MARQQLIVATEMQAVVQCLLAASDDTEIMECVTNESSSLSGTLIAALNACEAEQRSVARNAVTVENFVEVTVPAYSEMEFKQHFRLSRCTFEVGCLM